MKQFEKQVNESNVNVDEPFCDKCFVNLIERVEEDETGLTVYQECPKCHKQWVMKCDVNGMLEKVKVTENN